VVVVVARAVAVGSSCTGALVGADASEVVEETSDVAVESFELSEPFEQLAATDDATITAHINLTELRRLLMLGDLSALRVQ
jgi:hypothetical protein